MTEHASSVQAIQEDPDKGAELVVAAGIIAKEPIARKAIPQCNITCIDGENMRQALSGYLQVLYDLDPQAVGGALPEDSFYYIP
ncbi:MAG: ABC transporter substrate-binding protein, partial [Acetatifactor sp.]|nr:ABC transporter substrate-binding protein [Acetatifactor sp.]